MSKLQLAIIFGGKSTEHEISILSTQSILKYIDRTAFDLHLLKIDTNGHWWLVEENSIQTTLGTPVTLVPGVPKTKLIDLNNGKTIGFLDVVFPVLHGVFGEDGTIQGFFKMVDIPFVGCDVLASSTCMDKDVTKRLLRDSGISVVPYIVAKVTKIPSASKVEQELGWPVFIKPANLGSSVGVYKVKNTEDYQEKIKLALTYDHKVLIEKEALGKEVECSVLGNEEPKASLPGEVITSTDFYDFESKYLDAESSRTQIPASITDDQIEEVRTTAIKAYKCMGCQGLARVDFFVTKDDEVYINEINTLPGFTNISMYPKMWEASGIEYTQLLSLLIELALNKHEKDAKLNIKAKSLD